MRVLHFASSFSPLSQTFIYDYVMELEQQGVDNHVVTLTRQNEEQRPFPKVSVVPAPGRWGPVRLWYRGLAALGIGTRHRIVVAAAATPTGAGGASRSAPTWSTRISVRPAS